ncbi:MAG: cohesin domain-containing protein [Dehalococcoidia bacterium]|nr:cohesin domain-containing protein [Dehalococcoidia bacterium]
MPTPTPAVETRAFLWPESVTANPGDALTVSVWVNPGSVGISGGEIQVFFPSGVLEAVEVEAGDLLGPDALVGYREVNNTEGFVRIAIARVGPTDVPSPQGSFAVLTLRYRKSVSAGQYPLELRVGMVNELFQDVALSSIQGGLVTVQVP